MILGIGTDLVEMERIKKACEKEAFLTRIYTERERRQAVEAWLKRVPDEPGALLKAKFRLEHERRQKEGQ